MAQSFCRSFLAMLLRFFNFVQALFGFSLLLYSVWLLNRWVSHRQGNAQKVFDLGFGLLHVPWLVYFFMGAGVLVCLIAFIGNTATQAVNGCCLYFYSVLTALLVLLEAALATDLIFNEHWQEELPYDATGEIDNIQEFFKANADLCQWIAVIIVVIQTLSILFALVLRGMVTPRRVKCDNDQSTSVRRNPLLNPQSGYTIAYSNLGNAAINSDTWILKMRQKYGLNLNRQYNDTVDPIA